MIKKNSPRYLTLNQTNVPVFCHLIEILFSSALGVCFVLKC